LETRLVSPQYIKYIFTNDRFFEIQKLLAGSRQIINSDLQPICYSYTISIWLSKFFPNLAYSDSILLETKDWKNSVWIYVIVIVFFSIIFLITRKSQSMKRFLLVSAIGFLGMVLEIILILIYQNKNGILYRDIGILLMMFMVGLSLGAFIVNGIFIKIKKQLKGGLALGLSLLLGFTLLNIFLYLFIETYLIGNIIVISTVLLLDGVFVAGIFSFASLYKVENQQAVINRLYSADLLGGSLGAIIASLIFIPIYGFYITLIISVVLTFCCSFLIL
jgi:hypothetical protein